ncbi:MAG: tetratricopeptide repeat protein [bacterium]|nr:tetratricopeptide repeat protein [bacterium]
MIPGQHPIRSRSRRWTYRCVGLAAALAAGFATGCERLPKSAVQQIRQGYRAYGQRQYDRCARLVSPVIAEHATAPDTGEALYLRALCRIQTGRPTEARADLERGLEISDRDELEALIHVQLGNLDYEARHYRTAASHYNRAGDDLPDARPTDRIMLRHGISLQRSNDFRRGKRVLAELLLRFPNGSTAATARRKLAWPHDYHSIQCGVYSKAASARTAARKLRQGGFEAESWQQTSDGRTRYVVHSGKFGSYAEARRGLGRVRAVVPDAFIVP